MTIIKKLIYKYQVEFIAVLFSGLVCLIFSLVMHYFENMSWLEGAIFCAVMIFSWLIVIRIIKVMHRKLNEFEKKVRDR